MVPDRLVIAAAVALSWVNVPVAELRLMNEPVPPTTLVYARLVPDRLVTAAVVALSWVKVPVAELKLMNVPVPPATLV